MKHFPFPFVRRWEHDNKVNALEYKIQLLQEDLKIANAELDKFRAAQAGECIPSDRCNGCKHGFLTTEGYGIRAFSRTRCDLTLPQCQHFQAKEES